MTYNTDTNVRLLVFQVLNYNRKMKFTYLATILDFQAVEHLIRLNKQFQIIPWYQKHVVWHQNEVSRSVTLRAISCLINAHIAMVAIFDFIKNTQGWRLHTHMDIIMGVSNMNIQNIKTASNKPMSTLICW